MILAHCTFNSAQTNYVVVPAEPDRRIRVVKLLITAWVGVKVRLLSNPGPDPLSISPLLLAVGSAPLLMPLGERCAFVTELGEALGLTAVFQSLAGEYSVAVWYDLVN